jgi:hypothetical protein
MAVQDPRIYADINAVVGGYLRDLAFAQSSQQKMFGYKRAAAAIFALDMPLTDVVSPDGTWPKIPGIGPGSARVIREVLETGGSPTVEQAIESSGRRADIERRRELRRHFLSRAEVRPRALGSRLRGTDRRPVPRRPANALRMERRFPHGPGDRGGLP